MPAESDLDFGATIRAFAPGQRVFSRFSLVHLLGRGGMGVVWLAHDDKLERDVALKFLPEAVAMDPRAVDDLKRETRRSLELTHPHIVRIYDFFEDESAAAISMEHVDGGTLAKLAVEQPNRCYEPPQIIDWLRQLVDALEYAHEKAQIVHRDLKPANLMITSQGDLKVTDFGISATVTDSVTRVSKLASSGATPAYASPQQVMGERPSPLDDVYSLGASIFDLVTGRPPFHTGNLLVQVQSKVAPTMAERRRELGIKGKKIPESWERTIAACLAKDPGNRPQSAQAVIEGLEGGALKVGQPSATGEDVFLPEVPEQEPAEPVVPPNGDREKPPVKNLGDVFAWLWAMLAGRAGLVPQLLALAIPAALLIWAAVHFLSSRPPAVTTTYEARSNTPPAGSKPASVETQNPSTPPDDRGSGGPPPTSSTDRPRPSDESRNSNSPGIASGETGGTASASAPSNPVNVAIQPVDRGDSYNQHEAPMEKTSTPAYVPPPPPPVRSGTIRITSEPAGAAVIQDGREIGHTPFSMESHPGRREFTLKLSGYEDSPVAADVRSERIVTISAPLHPSASAQAQESRDFTIPGLEMPMIWISSGDFTMGAPRSETGPDSDERPETRVRITRGFWLGRTEVTQAQWQALTSSSSSGNGAAPKTHVSWEDAARFCRQLTAREQTAGRLPDGYAYCLPTEAQWDTPAARARPAPMRVTSRGSPSTEKAGDHRASSRKEVPTAGDSTICTATFPNGLRRGTETIPAAPWTTMRDRVRARPACSEAGPLTLRSSTSARVTAAMSAVPSVTTIADFASRWRQRAEPERCN